LLRGAAGGVARGCVEGRAVAGSVHDRPELRSSASANESDFHVAYEGREANGLRAFYRQDELNVARIELRGIVGARRCEEARDDSLPTRPAVVSVQEAGDAVRRLRRGDDRDIRLTCRLARATVRRYENRRRARACVHDQRRRGKRRREQTEREHARRVRRTAATFGVPGAFCPQDVPELPEVETIARGLTNAVVGKRIDSVVVFRPAVVSPDVERFAAELTGDRVSAVGRRGKFVVLSLESRRQLVVHLRMTGRLIRQRSGTATPEPYTNVLLTFGDGELLCFADVRRFGRMRLFEPEVDWAADVGFEPLSEEFSAEKFSSLLTGRDTPIKVFLLDQRRIAGIGNIYACEALWAARIRPNRPAGALSKPARRRLHTEIQSVLRRAIEMRGTSVDDYVDADGLRGGFQNVLSVYGRLGKNCPRCETPIVRTVIAGRGTWWCRACQN